MTLIRRGSGDSGATVVEFALVVPMLLMLLFGVLEVGRLVTTYAMVTTGAREAARYGSAVGSIDGGLAQYEDCDGIQDRAVQWVIIGSAETPDVEYFGLDQDEGDWDLVGLCPDPGTIAEGQRIRVSVTVPFEPILPLPGDFTHPITATHERTIGGQAAP